MFQTDPPHTICPPLLAPPPSLAASFAADLFASISRNFQQNISDVPETE